MNNFEKIEILIKNKKYDEAKKKLDSLSSNEQNNPNFNFLKAIIFLKLSLFQDAIEIFNSLIYVNSNNATFYFYRGFTFSKLNKHNEAKDDFEKAINLNPNSAELYNHLANVNYIAGENKNSIDNYMKSIELNKNLKQSYVGLFNVLSQTENIDKNKNKSEIIKSHYKLQDINFEYSSNKFIENKQIKELVSKINSLLPTDLNNIEFNVTQTYREQKLPPHCYRHKEIFKLKEIIPKRCFACYKIQIDVDNVVELIKLYIIFDKINLKFQNYRKCMIELRPNISGQYKGIIFSESIEEAKKIINEISEILEQNFNKEIKCNIKRGCSEYYEKYPHYNKLNDQAMNYNLNWEVYEKEFDEKNPELTFIKNSYPTVTGVSLFDAIAIKNWIAFAKLIDDKSYKTISDVDHFSKYIEKKLIIKKL